MGYCPASCSWTDASKYCQKSYKTIPKILDGLFTTDFCIIIRTICVGPLSGVSDKLHMTVGVEFAHDPRDVDLQRHFWANECKSKLWNELKHWTFNAELDTPRYRERLCLSLLSLRWSHAPKPQCSAVCETMKTIRHVSSCWLITPYHIFLPSKLSQTISHWSFFITMDCVFPCVSYHFQSLSCRFLKFCVRLWSWASNLWGSKPVCLRHAARPINAIEMHSRASSLLSLQCLHEWLATG